MGTLYRDLSQQLAESIDQGVYAEGERMPGLRKFSRQRKVSMATAVATYRALEEAGYLEPRDRSGYYVCPRQMVTLAWPKQTRPANQPVPVQRQDVIVQMLKAASRPDIIPLGGAIPHAGVLPQAALEKVTNSVLRQQRVASHQYSLPPGESSLLQLIAKRYAQLGCRINPDETIITNGAQEALWLALQSVTKPGDVVAIESPCFYGLLLILESLGLQALEIPTHPEQGICLESLAQAFEQWPIKACVVVPNYSNPLGTCMSDDSKERLVHLLAQKSVPLIEDDIYAELPHHGARPLPAKHWDKKGNNYICSSFSKTLSPGLRIGWINGPNVAARAGAQKLVLNTGSATLPQLIAARVLESGLFDRHLKQMRMTIASSVSSMKALIDQHFPPGTHITHPKGGFVLWVELPDSYDTEVLAQQALGKGVSIAPGFLFSSTQKYRNQMRLNCAIPVQSMETAVKRLAELLEDSPAFAPR